ncbi:hypothetical protein GCM10007906_44010 [Vibrio hyugaensis]|uniref:Uncharacterized protein n=1 Tax=Vibrio hyugaensis TaxID=1534743 RepID=A0ABQ5Y763_9VIBR|nr:hypothetical protein [Vibrio hyugaensis]GLR06813.1 hypothetical protein GCM10007906_44010 [Vibrio hyugaensis]
MKYCIVVGFLLVNADRAMETHVLQVSGSMLLCFVETLHNPIGLVAQVADISNSPLESTQVLLISPLQWIEELEYENAE